MADAGEFGFPVEVGVGEARGDALGVADAAAVRAAEAGPFLREGGGREGEGEGGGEREEVGEGVHGF